MAMRAEGHQVFEFQGGEPFMETPQPIKDAMTRALKENKTRYAPSSGIAPLREAILEKVRRKNKLPAELDQVIVTNGGMQSLFGAFQSVMDPGDEMLIFSPYWTPIVDLANFCEAKPMLVSTDEARRNGIKATLEKARNVIKRRDGNLTGNEVNEVSKVTGVADCATPYTRRKRPLASAVKVVLDKRRG